MVSFPAHWKIVSHLEQYPMSGEEKAEKENYPDLSDKKILKKIADIFAYTRMKPNELDFLITLNLVDLEERLELRKETKPLFVSFFLQALRNCIQE